MLISGRLAGGWYDVNYRLDGAAITSQIWDMPLITRENAVQMGKRSGQVRREAAQATANALANAQAVITLTAQPAIERAAEHEAWLGGRLVRVRRQLEAIDALLAAESLKKRPDAQYIDRLASATARLAEQERLLAGRPVPGSLKPTSRPRASHAQPATPQPVDSETAPGS